MELPRGYGGNLRDLELLPAPVQEDRPERCAEICVAEIFGDAVLPGVSAAVGMGLHPFRDPAIVEDFEAVRIPIDIAEFHTYAVDWTAHQVEFFVDGELIRGCPSPPAYPMQMMVAVFDFLEKSTGDDADAVPELIVDYLRGYILHPPIRSPERATTPITRRSASG